MSIFRILYLVSAVLVGVGLSGFLRNYLRVKKGFEPENNFYGRTIEKFFKNKVEENRKNRKEEKSVTRVKSNRKNKRKK